ncbi:uncharacterized protein DEA37_0004621 [Paragonimus westermani]|uniref:Saposin B-type domain-containing protein n=1 Tax=Paragonimus westermani TaxID=34504 RepID=A0A5J4NE92_9TREM|nr:uncharacterized protein DEA37_0004621 [Paragonimus westermani]
MRFAYVVTLTLLISSLFAKEDHYEFMNQRNIRFRLARTRQHLLTDDTDVRFLECTSCKLALEGSKQFLITDKLKNAIMDRVRPKCDQMGEFKKSCTEIAQEMLDFAFETLRNLSSRDVCAVFEFCPDPPQINFCPFCVGLLTQAELAILSSPVIEEAYLFLMGLCDNVHGFVSVCQVIMYDVFYNAVESIQVHFSPERVCQVSRTIRTGHVTVPRK